MITDRELTKQIMQRDIVNIYRQLPKITNQLGFNIAPMLGIFEPKILSYADVGVEMVLDWLFGTDSSGDLDEATDIAKMLVNDKIEEYRKKIREAKSKQENKEEVYS